MRIHKSENLDYCGNEVNGYIIYTLYFNFFGKRRWKLRTKYIGNGQIGNCEANPTQTKGKTLEQ